MMGPSGSRDFDRPKCEYCSSSRIEEHRYCHKCDRRFDLCQRDYERREYRCSSCDGSFCYDCISRRKHPCESRDLDSERRSDPPRKREASSGGAGYGASSRRDEPPSSSKRREPRDRERPSEPSRRREDSPDGGGGKGPSSGRDGPSSSSRKRERSPTGRERTERGEKGLAVARSSHSEGLSPQSGPITFCPLMGLSGPPDALPTPLLMPPAPVVTAFVDFLVRSVGGGLALAAENVMQYVNLPDNDGSVAAYDDVVEDRYRHGPRPRIRVRFSQPGRRTFRIASEALWGGEEYSSTGSADTTNEIARNARFRHIPLATELTTNDDGALDIDPAAFVLPASGRDRFRVKVTSEGVAEATSHVLTSWRFLSVLIASMPGSEPALVNRKNLVDQFERAGIKALTVTVVCTGSVDYSTETSEQQRRSSEALSPLYDRALARDFAGYTVELVLARNLARPRTDDISRVVNAARSAPKEVQVQGRTNADPTVSAHYLWSVVVADDWFVEGTFTPSDGRPVAIQPHQCAPSVDHRRVLVTLDGSQVGAGTITLKVKYAAELVNGFSIPRTNLIVVGTHDIDGTLRTSEAFNRTLVHEVGHAIGMVVGPPSMVLYGHALWARAPNRSANHYTTGGTGPHCHTPMPWGMVGFRGRWAEATCVMYETNNPAVTFCEHCIVTMRKIDLGSELLPLYWPVA